MPLDPNAPASELTIRTEIILRVVQSNATMMGFRGQYTIDESLLARSIITADKLLAMINKGPDDADDALDYLRKNYLQ